MSTPPTLADVLTNILNAITTILGEIASTIAANAGVVATVVVVGALAFMVMRYGSRILRGAMGWFRGLF
jgi:predicted PurR-regulated permease PerM